MERLENRPETDGQLRFSTSGSRSWRKTAFITLVVVFVSVQFILAGIRFFHNRRAEGQAEQWFAQAQGDAKPAWTEDDAARWLNEHVSQPYRGERSGSGGRHLVVDGYRQIAEGGIVVRPATFHITFLFDLNHRFQRVEYDLWPFDPPGRK